MTNWYDEHPGWLEHTERPGFRQWIRAYLAYIHDHELVCMYELHDIATRTDPRDTMSMTIREQLQIRGLPSRPCEADVPEPWEQMRRLGTWRAYLDGIPDWKDYLLDDPQYRGKRW